MPAQRGPEPVQDPGLEIYQRAYDVERQRVEVAEPYLITSGIVARWS
ncbi:MAG: hypothetical protein AVDCRST_MAG01-01-2050 [uncultured Rubrobacteraceae bacterium]|uniref:Uncharacterized protein n=1 Tax=uncultured Rubrobacteraceae bacterium TaxID=349277 RepID=A0A6J4PRK5_9ACTN|nr:MAG: hypothetical protein AVDCRST_MAG01-01-2050 [uncultured Rubrobacteraceae bacterium]